MVGKHLPLVCGSERLGGTHGLRVRKFGPQRKHGAADWLPTSEDIFVQTSNALLYPSAKEARKTSNFHQRLARSHRAESCAHFDCSELKTGQSQKKAKRFTLWHFGMTLPMQTLVSETIGQLALSLPEPASSKRISLEAGTSFCQACT